MLEKLRALWETEIEVEICQKMQQNYMHHLFLSRDKLKKWWLFSTCQLAIMVLSQCAARVSHDYIWVQQQLSSLHISALSHGNKYCLQAETRMDAPIHESPAPLTINLGHPISAFSCTSQKFVRLLHNDNQGIRGNS